MEFKFNKTGIESIDYIMSVNNEIGNHIAMLIELDAKKSYVGNETLRNAIDDYINKYLQDLQYISANEILKN